MGTISATRLPHLLTCPSPTLTAILTVRCTTSDCTNSTEPACPSPTLPRTTPLLDTQLRHRNTLMAPTTPQMDLSNFTSDVKPSSDSSFISHFHMKQNRKQTGGILSLPPIILTPQ